jgi:hypothetical protein
MLSKSLLEMLLVEPVHVQESILDTCVMDHSVDRQQLETEHYPFDLVDDVVETEQREEETHDDKHNHELDNQTDSFPYLELNEFFQELVNFMLYVNHCGHVDVLEGVVEFYEFRVTEQRL